MKTAKARASSRYFAESSVRTAEALLNQISGGTILDVGAGPGDMSIIWSRNGFKTTILDRINYSDYELRTFYDENITVITKDFFEFDTSKKYDTVIALHSISAEEGLWRCIEIANRRVINWVMPGFNEAMWSAKKSSYLDMLDNVMSMQESSAGKLRAFAIGLNGEHNICNVLSIKELREAWQNDRMIGQLHQPTTSSDITEWLIVVDKVPPLPTLRK